MQLPLRIAALPDFMARDAMFAITSGRASKMMRRVPMGHVTRSRSRPVSSRVRRVTLPTVAKQQFSISSIIATESPNRELSVCAGGTNKDSTHQDPQGLVHLKFLLACPPISLSVLDPTSSAHSDLILRSLRILPQLPCLVHWRLIFCL